MEKTKGQRAKKTNSQGTAEAGAQVKTEDVVERQASFPKQARLRKRPEFLSLSRWGKKVYGPHFLIITNPNKRGETRLGVTVSSKVGNAVVRNRVKRLLRECFRRHRHQIVPSRDVLIIARKGAANLSWYEVDGEIREILIENRGRRK